MTATLTPVTAAVGLVCAAIACAGLATPARADTGGPTWQLRGRDYVADFYGFLGAPVEEAVYRDAPGWMDWYDTHESQRILKYQNSSYQHYSREMEALVESLMAG